jgi:hypothetical protein
VAFLVAYQHRPLYFTPRPAYTLGGGVSETLKASDTCDWVPAPTSGFAVLRGRHKHHPIAVTHPRGPTSPSGSIGESATVVDTVTASWLTSASAAESLTIVDSETYPSVIPLAQLRYGGRQAPILFRQPESSIVESAVSVVESMSAADAQTGAAGYACTIGELLTAIDHFTANQVTSDDLRKLWGLRRQAEEDDTEEGDLLALLQLLISQRVL